MPDGTNSVPPENKPTAEQLAAMKPLVQPNAPEHLAQTPLPMMPPIVPASLDPDNYIPDPVFEEKRSYSRRDPVLIARTVAAAAGWLCAAAMLILFSLAMPNQMGFSLAGLGEASYSQQVNAEYINTAFISGMGGLAFGLIGTLFQIRRLRRKTDKFSAALIGLGIVSAGGLVALLAGYASYIF